MNNRNDTHTLTHWDIHTLTIVSPAHNNMIVTIIHRCLYTYITSYPVSSLPTINQLLCLCLSIKDYQCTVRARVELPAPPQLPISTPRAYLTRAVRAQNLAREAVASEALDSQASTGHAPRGYDLISMTPP